MLDLFILIVIVVGAPILVAVASITLLDWLAPDGTSNWWPRLAGWWFPALLLAYGLYENQTRRCPPYDECGGLGAAMVTLLAVVSVVTGFLLGPFAARRALRYLRKS